MAILANDRNITLDSAVRLIPISISLATVVDNSKITLISIINTINAIASYEYRVGPSWIDSTLLVTTSNSYYDYNITIPGIYTLWVVATDVYKNVSTAASTVAVISAPGYSSVSALVIGANIKLDWTLSTGTFIIDAYEIRYGTLDSTWDTATTIGAPGTTIGTTKSTTYTTVASYLGDRLWWVAAKDITGNYSTATSINVTINAPSAVSGIRADIVDNNVLLYWTQPVIGYNQLPIDQYEVRKGSTWDSGILLGSNANSTFSSIFEQASGSYTYWIACIDTAGTYGTPTNLVATVNQPPDYLLRNDYNSTLVGSSTNMYLAYEGLVGPVDTSQTWDSHYTINSWNSIADQVSAGYPIYATPSMSTGTYEEVLDYGTAIPSTIVTVSLTSIEVVGTVTSTITLSHKLNIGDAWTVLTTGANIALLPLFRYLKVHYDFACTVGSNLINIRALNVKLSIKQRTDSGNAVSIVGGTSVTFGYPFIAADTPIVQPSSSSILIPVVIYTGGTNPTSFIVKIYNLAGTEVGGAFSWSVRGY